MEKKEITTTFYELTYQELELSDRQLVESAIEGLSHSYSPYSRFQVSCSILLSNKEIITGTNQENVSYPSGLCAERTAMFYANSKYPDSAPLTLAIAAKSNGEITEKPITPCGACRQVILETEQRFSQKIRIILCGRDKYLIINSIRDLLPLSFDEL